MNFDVSLSDGAAADILAILKWIDDRSRPGASTWLRKWDEVLQSIRARADHFGPAPESYEYREAIRQVVFKTRRGRPYRALFVIREMHVYVLHVRGPGQNVLSSDEIRLPD